MEEYSFLINIQNQNNKEKKKEEKQFANILEKKINFHLIKIRIIQKKNIILLKRVIT